MAEASPLDVLAGLLDVDKGQLAGYLVEKPKPDPYLALPRPRTVNIFVVVEAQSELVIRHEGGEDFTEFEVAGYRVPGILNTKLQSAQRRALLRLLYSHYDRRRDELVAAIENALKGWGGDALPITGAEKVLEKLRKGWRCYMAPKQSPKQASKRGKECTGSKKEEIVEPYCGFCPNCMIYGYAGLEEAGSYNVKSRVEGDVFYGLCRSSACVTQRTFNAVDDVTKTTFYTGGESGALYQLSLIEPGTVFVGKIAARDLSAAELLAVLLALVHVERIGARVTHFGRVKIHIPALVFSSFERGSGYELAAQALRRSGGAPLGLEDAVNEVTEYAKRQTLEGQDLFVAKRSLADELRRLGLDVVDAVLEAAWRDGLAFKSSIELFLRSKQKQQRR